MPILDGFWHIDASFCPILSAPKASSREKTAYRYVDFSDSICLKFLLLKISTDKFFTFSVSICSIKHHYYCLNILFGQSKQIFL